MIEPAALLAWSALALAVTLSPGPDTLLVASHAARGGLRAGMAALMGIMTAVVVWYGSLIAFGLLSVLVAAPALFLAVKIAGALYLAWLGGQLLWRAVRNSEASPLAGEAPAKPAEGGLASNGSSGDGALHPDRPPPPSPPRKGAGSALAPFRQGFLTNALNPKVALFYLAALPQFTNEPLIGVMLLAIHAAFGLIWLSFIAFAAARARTIVWKSAFVRWLEAAVGAFFIGAAGRLALAQH